MRLTPRRPQRNDFELVVTSMLDINFLLIMFFIVTAHFQRETHAELELPQEQGEKQKDIDEAGLVINVAASGDIIVSGRSTDLEELRTLVRAQADKAAADSSGPLKLMVRADRNASTEHLNRVVSMLRELGVGTIRIATEIPIF